MVDVTGSMTGSHNGQRQKTGYPVSLSEDSAQFAGKLMEILMGRLGPRMQHIAKTNADLPFVFTARWQAKCSGCGDADGEEVCGLRPGPLPQTVASLGFINVAARAPGEASSCISFPGPPAEAESMWYVVTV